jgi:hypothetical protein
LWAWSGSAARIFGPTSIQRSIETAARVRGLFASSVHHHCGGQDDALEVARSRIVGVPIDQAWQ